MDDGLIEAKWLVRSERTSVELWAGEKRIVTAECTDLQRGPLSDVFQVIAKAHNENRLSDHKVLREALEQIRAIEPDTLWSGRDRYSGERREEKSLCPTEVFEIIDAALTTVPLGEGE